MTMSNFLLKGRKNNAPVGSKRLFQKIEKLTLLRQAVKAPSSDEWEMSILPWQFSKLPSRDFEEMGLEEQIAYKLLMVNLLDVTSLNKEKRLKSIAEIYQWMQDDARKAPYNPGEDGFEYRFETWCENLGVDEGYMTRKLKPFLVSCTKAVKGVN